MVDFLLNITYNENTKNASYQVQQKVGVCMNTIITIGRQFGSAGREIGEKVAEYFGIKCYDKELLIRAAQESGFCEEMIQNHDERPTNSGNGYVFLWLQCILFCRYAYQPQSISCTV